MRQRIVLCSGGLCLLVLSAMLGAGVRPLLQLATSRQHVAARRPVRTLHHQDAFAHETTISPATARTPVVAEPADTAFQPNSIDFPPPMEPPAEPTLAVPSATTMGEYFTAGKLPAPGSRLVFPQSPMCICSDEAAEPNEHTPLDPQFVQEPGTASSSSLLLTSTTNVLNPSPTADRSQPVEAPRVPSPRDVPAAGPAAASPEPTSANSVLPLLPRQSQSPAAAAGPVLTEPTNNLSADETEDTGLPGPLAPPVARFRPRRLPETLDTADPAAPIDPREAERLEHIRDMVRKALPRASRAERDVWHDELKNLPPRMIRELLELRRLFGGRTERWFDDPSGTASIKTAPAQPEDSGPHVPPAATLTTDAEDSPQPYAPAPPGRIRLPAETGRTLLPAMPHDAVSLPVLSQAESSQLLHAQLAPSLDSLHLARRVILNNIANASTNGFRRSRVTLTPLPAEVVRPQAAEDDNGPLNPAGVLVGLGVEIAATQVDHTAGDIRVTGRPLDVAVSGEGWFQVMAGDEIMYTRCGNFTRDNEGNLVLAGTQRHYPIEPAVSIPDTATTIRILPDGLIHTTPAGEKPEKPIGRIQLSRFINPDGLEPRGEGLFAATRAAGRPFIGNPGDGGLGTLQPGALEESNVNIEEELRQLEQFRRQEQALRSALGTTGPRYSRPGGIVGDDARFPRVANQPRENQYVPPAPPATGYGDPATLPLPGYHQPAAPPAAGTPVLIPPAITPR